MSPWAVAGRAMLLCVLNGCIPQIYTTEARATAALSMWPAVDLASQACMDPHLRSCATDLEEQYLKVGKFWEQQEANWKREKVDNDFEGSEIIYLAAEIAKNCFKKHVCNVVPKNLVIIP